MKNNPTLSGLIITIGITAVCYFTYMIFLNKKDSYLITNPSDDYLELQIDEQTYTLAPNQIVPIKLKGGQHTLNFTFNGEIVDTVFRITRHNAIINPTRADYYVFVRPYGARRNADSIFTHKTITIDNRVYNGDITHYNDLYIEDFYYNLDQEYPNFFIKKGEKTDLSKIFSKEDFMQFYFDNYE